MEKTERALAEVHPALTKGLNINAVIPYLNKHDLVTRQEYEILLNDLITTDEKINKLVSWLPTKGPNAVERFITCLNESGSGTGHKTLAEKIEKAVIAADPNTYTLNHAIDSLDTRDQILVLNFVADKINKLLDLSAVLPSLHLHHLINEEENDFFSDPQISREVKMKELKMILPGKGSKFLSRFVICLKATTHGTKHQELITAILSAAKIRNTLCKILGFFRSICRCLCKCVCFCCTSICCLLLLIIAFFVVGRLTSYGVSMDKPDMIPFTELPKSYSKVLPRLRNIFVGRENETQQLLDYLHFNNSNVRIVGIFGGPGFGKSTLAIQASHILASTNITIEYYDLSEVSFVPYLLYRILETSTNITEHTAILEELKKWADTIETDTILVFDGCDILFSGSQKGELQNVIEILVKHSDNIKILLTSRYRVSFFDFKSVTLNELKVKDATTLLKNLTSGTSELTLKKIAVLVGNVPLALQVVGALLEMDRMTPEKIVLELSRNPIETLSPNDLPINSQIHASLQLSYSSLDEFTQRCGRYLAHFPGSFSEDAAFGVLAYMVNETYWYSELFQELNIFLHWIPKPSACLDTLVHHSLLKFHPTLQRYLFHKLIREFFLHSQAEENEFEEEKSVFRLGFSIYFVEYWNIFHTYVWNYDYDPSILAALDLERHNFELMETFLPELGEDISYIQTYIAQAEIYASDNLQSLIDYFQHLRNTASKDYLKNRMNNCKSIILMLDLHSKVAIKEKGPQKYMEIFVELMLQNSAYQEYLFNTERALTTLKERRHRVMEIYGEHGSTVSDSVHKYYQYILKYSLETGDIDIYFEAFQKMIMLKSEVITLRKHNNEQRKGLSEFGAENYEKAKKHYRQYFKQTLEASDYLYTKVLLYYCYLFSTDQDKAMKIVHSLDSDRDHLRVYNLVVNYFNVEQVKVLSMFYAKVRPGTYEHNLINSRLKHFQDPMNIKEIRIIRTIRTFTVIEEVCSSNDENCS